ncbi:metallophosphoesterase family protein [Imhoffiella purpurea]|uniref:Calcineurin-like phosphoesterase domain-containing protein n=1 Tax=Imhoffiella purpurea TaxID=1249627 RepID=W9VHL9_9GAMM|nr:metallophosphoesterase family protein [Imhoffiella purpurea]EXJ16496.1 hypothetical protein D779_0097 [Imhoffiella purpurea]
MNKIRRLGLIGDIHGDDALLEQALRLLSERGVERIAATGDIVDGPGSIDRCCELLAAHRVLAVRGNHDRWLLEGVLRDLPHATLASALTPTAKDFIAGLPPTLELDTPRGRLLLCHGLGPHDTKKVNPDDSGYALESNFELQELLCSSRGYRWILNGHSHRRMVRHFPEGTTIVNAGTLGPDEHSGGCLELDFETGVARLFEFTPTGRLDSAPSEIPLLG